LSENSGSCAKEGVDDGIGLLQRWLFGMLEGGHDRLGFYGRRGLAQAAKLSGQVRLGCVAGMAATAPARSVHAA
jgi:hypothetical protein